MKARRIRASEHDEQTAVIGWWATACRSYRLPEFALFAIPNAAKRSYALARHMKNEGLRAGVPDLLLAVAKRVAVFDKSEPVIAHGLFLEMKRRPNKPSEEQEAVIMYLRRSGYHVVVAYDADEAIQAIRGYLR